MVNDISKIGLKMISVQSNFFMGDPLCNGCYFMGQEGFERGGSKEFSRFLTIAKGSSGEVRCQLYIAYDLGYLDRVVFERLINEVSEVSRMIAGLIKYLRSKEGK